MGKKKKGSGMKPWCFYCDRVFDDEKVLMSHQKVRHFKCLECHKKLTTSSGLAVHMEQVHHVKLDKVPHAKEGRDDPSIEVFGMGGIPRKFIEERKAMLNITDSATKKQKTDAAGGGGMVAPIGATPTVPAGFPGGMPPGFPPGYPPHGFFPRGMPPGMPPPGMPPGMGWPPHHHPQQGAWQRPGAAIAGAVPRPMFAVGIGSANPMFAAPARAGAGGAAGAAATPSAAQTTATTAAVPTATTAAPSTPTGGATSGAAAATSTGGNGPASAMKKLGIVLVHPDEDVSMEEVRARQSRYKYDASAVKERLSKLEAALNANSVLAGAGGVGI